MNRGAKLLSVAYEQVGKDGHAIYGWFQVDVLQPKELRRYITVFNNQSPPSDSSYLLSWASGPLQGSLYEVEISKLWKPINVPPPVAN